MNDMQRNEMMIVIKRLPRYTKLIYSLYKSPFVTRKQKLILSTAMGYLISPIELVPGFIPVAGQVDDLIIVLMILKRVFTARENKPTKDIFMKHGITLEMIDEDIQISMRTAKAMMLKLGLFVGKSLLWVGKGSIDLGKKAMRKRRPKNERSKKNLNPILHKKPKYSKNE